MSRRPTDPECKAFENTSTNIAAAQMRNSLTELAETVTNPEEKKLFETEMDNFFSLFRRYLNDKSKGNAVYVALPDRPQLKHIRRLANTILPPVTGTASLPPHRTRSLITRISPTPSR